MHILPTKEVHYDVPLCSVLGPIFLFPFIQRLSNLIKQHSLSVHLFADDIQIKTSILPQHVHSAISSMETCFSDVKNWMIDNKLLLSDEKTECPLIHVSKCTQNLNCVSPSFGHNVMSFSTTAKNLGFHFTDDMIIDAHVQDTFRQVYIDIRRISYICHLSIDATKTLLGAFVLTKFYYCDSLFFGSPMYMLKILQNVQNSTARLIYQCCNKIIFHPLSYLCTGCPLMPAYNTNSQLSVTFFLGLSPIHLSDLLSVCTPKGNLRSSSDNVILCISKLRTKTFWHCSFSFTAPTIWNSLPM